jgi:hypothetical protein
VAEIVPSEKRYGHWEIYIDESGNTEGNFFRVAGLMVGYESEAQAKEIHGKMNDLGIRWGGTPADHTWTSGSTRWLEKPRNDTNGLRLLDDQWNSIATKLEEITIDLPKYSFCLAKEFRAQNGAPVSGPKKPQLCDPDSLDNLYFSLLNDVLEAALFDVLAKVNSKDSPTMSIFAGSRLRPIPGAPSADPAWVRENREKYAAFGVSLRLVKKPPVPAYQSLQMDGVLPVASELLEVRRGNQFAEKLGARIESAAAIPMNQPHLRSEDGFAKFEGEWLTSPAFRHLHFVADILASLADAKSNAMNYGVLTPSSFGFGNDGSKNKALFARREGRDRGFNCLQRISRLLDSQETNLILAAWLFLQMEQTVTEIQTIGIFGRSVLIRLRTALEKDLTGLVLQQLVSAVPDASRLIVEIESLKSRCNKLRADVSRLEDKAKPASTIKVKCKEKIISKARTEPSPELFAELKRKWQVRQFDSLDGCMRASKELGQNWHTLPGVQIRRTTNKVRVFVEMASSNGRMLPDFFEPSAPNIFWENGTPRGVQQNLRTL